MPQGKLKVKAQLPVVAAKKKAARAKKAGKVTKVKTGKAGKKGNEHLKNIKSALEKAIREDIESSVRAQAISTDGRSMNTGASSSGKGSQGRKN